jgi:hypothetical protein
MTEPIADDVVWGLKGLAAELGIPLRRARYFVQQRIVPYRRVGKKRLAFSRKDLRDWWHEDAEANDVAKPGKAR